MMKFFILFWLMVFLISCNKNIYGLYDTSHDHDKSCYSSLLLKPNNTFERKEIHTIQIFSIGTWEKINNKIICYHDSTDFGFSKDTTVYKLHGNKLFFTKNNGTYKVFLLKRKTKK